MDEYYMNEALKESKKALKKEEVPVGCVVICENKIIGKGHNKKELKNDSTMHAEIIAIKEACKTTKDWRLNKCSIYVTMEPCPMCMGAIKEARIENIVCGTKNETYKDVNKKIIKDLKINIKYGVLEEKISEITKKFFNSIRNR